MAGKKIVDEGEVVRWFEEGRTYRWMSDEYMRKYNIEMTSSAWGNFRRRKGLDRRNARDDDLIPWYVKKEHRLRGHVQMLRREARRRQGMNLSDDELDRLESWLRALENDNAVIHYDPDTQEGWFRVPREPGDDDIIRRPKRKTTLRREAD